MLVDIQCKDIRKIKLGIFSEILLHLNNKFLNFTFL